MAEFTEYRGVEGLVYAEVLEDSENAYTTGTVKSLAGVAEISRTTDSSTESHYYDNIPAIVITSAGADTLTCTVSAIPLETLAEITGQVWDATKGAMIEGNRQTKYFAMGYKTKKTNGDEIYVWRYKGTFGVPDQVNHTENESTDANSQELIFTGVSTMHKFTATGKGAKALNVDVALELANVSTFFAAVTTPDTLTARV